jgi:PAS domain S-box-containing protein
MERIKNIRMSLRLKTLIIAVLSLLGLAIGIGIVASVVMGQRFRYLENNDVRQNASRVKSAIEEEFAQMNAVASAWGLWDDALQFLQGQNEATFLRTMTDSALQPAESDVIIYLASNGALKFATGYDTKRERRVALPRGIKTHLKVQGPLLGHASSQSRIKGILMLEQGPLLVVSCPVTATTGKGPIRGSFILGRFLNQEKLQKLADVTHLNLSYQRYDGFGMPSDFAHAREYLTYSSSVYIQPVNQEFIAGYIRVEDLYKRPALLMRLDIRRHIYEQGQLGIRSIVFGLLAATVLFSIVMLVLLERLVLRRLSQLSHDVKQINPEQAEFPHVCVDGNDELTQLMLSINNLLSAIQHSHQQLRDSEERFRLVSKATNEVIYDWDIINDAVWWGDTLIKYFGHEFGEAYTDTQTWMNLIHPDDFERVQTGLQQALTQDDACWSEEYRFLRRDGSYTAVVERGYVIRDEAGQAIRMVGSVQDVSERKRFEEALQRAKDTLEIQVQERTAELAALNQQLQIELRERSQAEQEAHRAREEAERANEAKSEFLSRMSHELRTPLNAILGFGQLLEVANLPPRQQQGVQHILQGGRHLLGLINEVLDIAKVESGHVSMTIEPINVGHLIREAIEMVNPLAAQNHIEIQHQGRNDDLPQVSADIQRLRQVLINLLSNAIKYNRPYGQVIIACQTTAEDQLHITIRDSGRGIAQDDISKLFQPFERLNISDYEIEGTGLGLAFSKLLIEAMNGSIQVESIVGEGSIFTIELPLAKATPQQPVSQPNGDILRSPTLPPTLRSAEIQS